MLPIPSDTDIISGHQVIAPIVDVPRSDTSVEESEASDLEVVQGAVDSDDNYSQVEELEDSEAAESEDDVEWLLEVQESEEKKISNFYKPPLSPIAFQQLQHELNKDGDVFLDALKIGSALKKFNQLDFHDQLCGKPWTPLPSKFEGVQEYLEFIGKNGTAYEEVMYLSTLEFASSFRPATFFRMTHSLGGGFWKNELVHTADQIGEASTCSIENGLLTVRQFYKERPGEEKKQYKRTYYLKTSDLIRSVDSFF